MAEPKVFTQSFAELYGPKFGIYVNDQQMGIDGRQVYQLYGVTDQDLKSSIRFSESGALKIHSDKSIEIAAGEYNEDKGVDINIQARRGNVNIKADRNGNVTVSGANIIVHASKNLDLEAGKRIRLISNDIQLRANYYSVRALSGNGTPLLEQFIGRIYTGTQIGTDFLSGEVGIDGSFIGNAVGGAIGGPVGGFVGGAIGGLF
jgi:hypothetical protein|tara:strand:- start:4843 stop:5454 length:612 start_codon:yes stop_codon:yes gene_type:complete